LLQILDQLFDSHAFLKAGFWKKIKVAVKNQKFVQVPAELFSEDSIGEYLKFNATIDAAKEGVYIELKLKGTSGHCLCH
jgi:hypothetical protein